MADTAPTQRFDTSGFFSTGLEDSDPEVFAAIGKEQGRQQHVGRIFGAVHAPPAEEDAHGSLTRIVEVLHVSADGEVLAAVVVVDIPGTFVYQMSKLRCPKCGHWSLSVPHSGL